MRFGQLDASQEAVDEPDLLLEGFYDYRQAAYGIATGQIWLLLGPKGAGKSAVLEHLRLSWQPRYDRFFDYWDLRSFPVNDVTQIQTGQSPGAARAQAAWELLLLLRVLDSFASDQALKAPAVFYAVKGDLVRTGLLAGDWRTKVVEWSKATVKFNLQVAEIGVEFSNTPVGALQVTAILKKLLEGVSTDSRHLIALDGLDSFFFEAEDEWVSLAGLLHAIASVNRFLAECGHTATVVAAVRSDIFEVAPSAESNKMISHSVHLDWSALGIGTGNHLWQLMTAKAAVSRPGLSDLTRTYMGTPIEIGPHTTIPEYFLDNTRLLPRDMVALMGYTQQVHPGSGPISQGEARAIITRYCAEYFQGEILDNLAGILPTGSARKLPIFRDALRTVPWRQFTFDDVQRELEGELDASETKALLRQMFEVGGIGVRTPTGSVEYTDFTFRKVSGAGFTAQYGFLLHDALTTAWNRPWSARR
ncbi:MAG: hypothetical protein QOE76_3583 [Frankiales bacterium]|nr:hypothetical protein [Frankiales bacterium]